MKHLFDQARISLLIRVLLILLLVKLVWFIVELVWLPSTGVDHIEEVRAKPLYYRVRLASSPVKSKAPKPKKRKPQTAGSIKDITLLAIYKDGETVVVTVKYKGKSKVLGRGEKINGFTLEDAGRTYALFSKKGKTYEISLKPLSKSNGSISTVRSASPSQTDRTVESDGIVDAGDRKIVDRALIDRYTHNIDDIYKNIGVQEVKGKDGIEGFKVTFVKRKSPFAQLGLKRGDIITAINGEPLNSYSAALNIYSHMKEIQNLTLTIKRRNQEMELEYEIN